MASTPLLLRLSLLSSHPLKPHFPNRGSIILLPRRTLTNLPLTIGAAKSPPRRTAKTTTCMSSFSSSYNNNTTPATDRLVSAVAYVLPLIKGLSYGRFLFAEHPGLAAAVEPALPLLNLYHSVPYSGLVSFVALYLGLARNPRLSRYVRFNAMQAVVLNVLLALPPLFQLIFFPGRTGLGYKLMVMVYNTLFVFVVCCFVYSVVCCVLGRTPYLPFVAEAADRQV